MLKHGKHGEKYNVQGEIELDTLQVAQFVAKELGKELKYKMHDNPTSRPGHDLRYALDGDKLRQLGWKLPLTFEDSLRKTIRWMVQNPDWLDEKNFRGGAELEGGGGERQMPMPRGALAPGAGVKSVVEGGAFSGSGVDKSASMVQQARSKL